MLNIKNTEKSLHIKTAIIIETHNQVTVFTVPDRHILCYYHPTVFLFVLTVFIVCKLTLFLTFSGSKPCQIISDSKASRQ